MFAQSGGTRMCSNKGPHLLRAASTSRRKLLERIDNVTTDSAGAIHVSDELQRDIDRFNDDERRRHEGMKLCA